MCASAKQYTVDTLPAEQLRFSFGGGFTGEVNEYLLLPNGQLFARKQVVQELPFREQEPIDAKVAKELFGTYDEQNFDALDYDDPGNMTYSIQHVNGSDTTRLTWGGTRVKPAENLRTYWRRVMGLLDTRKPEPLPPAPRVAPNQ